MDENFALGYDECLFFFLESFTFIIIVGIRVMSANIIGRVGNWYDLLVPNKSVEHRRIEFIGATLLWMNF